MKNIEIKTERHESKSSYDEDSILYWLSSPLLEYGYRPQEGLDSTA